MSSPFKREANKQERAACERELDEALEELDETIEASNGKCQNKVRYRSTATRRALRVLAKDAIDADDEEKEKAE